MNQQKTSSIPQVKAALVGILGGLFADADGVQVSYGLPKPTTKQIVVVGGTLNPEQQTWATLGDRQRGEEYALQVFIEIDRNDPTQQEATERAFELLASIEEAVRDDVHLGLADSYRSLEAQITQAQFFEWPNGDGQGYAARVDTAILIKTRI